jgi:glycerol-3-phosphate acyltransferase PlsY
MDIVLLIVCGILGYLLGSVNTSVILSKLVYKEDIRQKGSGNAGTTNALRTFGKKAAAVTLLGDLVKGILAVLLAWLIAPEGASELAGVIAGAGAILGHNFPLYFGFKGGKGVLTTLAVMLMLAPIPAVIALIVFIVVVAISRYVSLGSIIAAFVLPFLIFFRGNYISMPGGLTDTFWLSVGVAVLIIARHHANIGRLIRGEESRIFAKKEKDDH